VVYIYKGLIPFTPLLTLDEKQEKPGKKLAKIENGYYFCPAIVSVFTLAQHVPNLLELPFHQVSFKPDQFLTQISYFIHPLNVPHFQ